MTDLANKMDSIANPRQNLNKNRGNKENTQPARQTKTSVKNTKNVLSLVNPLHLKRIEKEEPLAKGGILKKGKSITETVKSSSKQPLKKLKTTQKDGTQSVVGDGTKRQTLSHTFLSQQAVKHRKLVAEVTKPANPPVNPPAAVPTVKSAPGMYKGRVIQSKIGSIWKSNVAAGGADQNSTAKPLLSKVKSTKVETMTKTRSKSVVELHGRVVQRPKPRRSNSVSDGFPPISRHPINSRPITNFTRTSTAPAKAAPSSRNTTTMPKGKETQRDKAKVQVTADRKVSKPPVLSTISQYRVSKETAEERRAKLAEWLASKGKTLKRPVMSTAPPPKIQAAAKPQIQLKSQLKSFAEPQHPVQHKQESNLHSRKFSTAASLPEDERTSEQLAHDSSAHDSTLQIMNTTLDLVDNSDEDLPVDPEFRMCDVVVNLCEALAALETPSNCEEEPLQNKDSPNDTEKEDDAPKAGCQEELVEELVNGPGDVEVEDEANEKDLKQQVEKDEDSDDDVESDDDEDDDDEKGMMKATPKIEEASVVKYSIKTTPYLQSVKKTIEGNTSASRSLRKNGIKDIKFLTPVRRSCRIQRQSSHLPGMLADHDPCVSSLAELVKLDDEANAYIYRKNPALLEDLPDQLEEH